MNGYEKSNNTAIESILNILQIESVYKNIDFDVIETKYNGSLQDYINIEMPDVYEDIYDDWSTNVDFTQSEMEDILYDFTIEDVYDVLYMYGLENEYDAEYVYEHIEPWVVIELYNPIKVEDNWIEAYIRLQNAV